MNEGKRRKRVLAQALSLCGPTATDEIESKNKPNKHYLLQTRHAPSATRGFDKKVKKQKSKKASATHARACGPKAIVPPLSPRGADDREFVPL